MPGTGVGVDAMRAAHILRTSGAMAKVISKSTRWRRGGTAAAIQGWLLAMAAALAGLTTHPEASFAEPPKRAAAEPVSDADVASAKAVALIASESYADALRAAEEEVALREQYLAREGRKPSRKQPPDLTSEEDLLAKALDHLGRALIELGDYDRATRVIDRAALLHKRATPPDNGQMLIHLYDLGRLAVIKRDFAAAERAFKVVVDSTEPGANGSGESSACRFYSALARLYAMKGDYARAESLRERALDAPAARGLSLHSSTPLNDIAECYMDVGRVDDAERVLEMALKSDSSWHTAYSLAGVKLARTLNNLGRLYLETRDPASAALLFERALALEERWLGASHPSVAVSLDGLAQCDLRGGEMERAEPRLARALGIQEKALGKDHPDTAVIRLHLADLRREKGDLRAAAELYQRVLEDREKALGPEHLLVAEVLLRQADLGLAEPNLKRSRGLCERAAAIAEKALGPDSEKVAAALDKLAETGLRMGDAQLAARALERSAAIRDGVAAARVASGSEQQRATFMASLSGQTNLILSLAAAEPRDSGAASLALTTILRRKGRVLDALTQGRAALRDRRSPEDKVLLDEMVSIQSKIVDLIVAGPGLTPIERHRAAIVELERQKQRLEVEVSKQSARLIADDRGITLAQVQAAIPVGAALVELLVYQPYGSASGKAKSGPRVAAYVTSRRGGVAGTDLGSVSAIEALIEKLIPALADPTRDPKPLARALDEQVMKPLRALLGDTHHVLLSPDGALNLVPFGALVDEAGQYLVEQTSFTYLGSGRDLVRYTYDETPGEPGPAALVIGAPDFGDADRKRSRYRTEDKEMAVRSIPMGKIRFPSLPGTEAEARAISALLPGAKVLLGAEATEEALKAALHPRILHVASHGFFVPEKRAQKIASGTRGAEIEIAYDNPLLRAGLALATANQPVPGKQDGILTALEASGLDLYGTRLVVLSACETGVGEARNGDGVYGLRRALSIAGAQTLVMSLWKISDQETRDLMTNYYQALIHGGGRSEALREVALRMRAEPRTAHPYYWASFIASGDGSTLDGKPAPRAPSPPAQVARGPRGCGCALPGEERGHEAALLGAALAVWVARRRRG